jgi:hypothetical protein
MKGLALWVDFLSATRRYTDSPLNSLALSTLLSEDALLVRHSSLALSLEGAH